MATKTILTDSSVLAEAAHFFCCCRGDHAGPARGRIRTQTITLACCEAVDCYGAVADSPELEELVRSVRYWTRRFRNAVARQRKGRITEAQYLATDRSTEIALGRLGSYVLDQLAYSGREFTCHLHPEHGSWSFPKLVA